MVLEQEKYLSELKKQVEKKFGQEVRYSRDCEALSQHIFESTSRQISVSTLKRLWSIIKSRFQPSTYTLDSLSRYVGYRDWESFGASQKSDKHQKNDRWSELKAEFSGISEYYLNFMKTRMGGDYSKTFERKFARRRLERFLESDKSAMVFFAPEGYGKSTLLVSLYERFFKGENALYPNDIALLVDYGIVGDLLSPEFDFEAYIMETLGFAPNSHRRFFLQHPELHRGRVVLILDGFNETTRPTGKLEEMINNLLKITASNQKTHWFKLVISCTPNVWNLIQTKLENSEKAKLQWFDADFEGYYTEDSNVPPLKKKEVRQILENYEFPLSYRELRAKSPEFGEILKIPFFLNLYLSLWEKNSVPASEIDLLQAYFDSVLKNDSQKARISVLKKFAEQTGFGKKADSVSKEELLGSENGEAYRELVAQGMLYEYVFGQEFLNYQTRVKFTHAIFFDFLLANFLLQEQGMNREAFTRLFEQYSPTPERLNNLFRWFVKFAFRRENTEVLEPVFDLIDRYSRGKTEINHLTKSYRLISIVGLELRHHPAMRQRLVPVYAAQTKSRRLYFERFIDFDFVVLQFAQSIEQYLQHARRPREKIYGNYIKFLASFLAGKTQEVQQCDFFDKAQSVSLPLFNSGVCYYCRIVANFYNKQEEQGSLIDKIVEHEKTSPSQPQTLLDYYFYFFVVDALNMCERYEESIRFMQQVIFNYRSIRQLMISRFYVWIKLFYALALLKTGRHLHGRFIFDSIYVKDLPTHSKYFWTIRYLFIEVEFLRHDQEYQRALKKLNKIIDIASMLKMKFFEDKAQQMIEEIKQLN